MKVSIIGGGGRVGADAAFAEALDLRHGAALTSSQVFTSSGTYEIVDGSDCVVITAGLRRKPDETRLDLINRNVGLFKGILESVKACKLPETATILVVSNPVDILTHMAAHAGILPPSQVIGLGTVLDTSRFRSLIADHLKVAATDLKALILGEHGDSMVPIWSSATISGVPLATIPGFSEEVATELFKKTQTSGAEVIRQKGGAGRAVGVSIKEVVEAMALDQGMILPVSAVQNGKLGISDISLSLPTRVGRQGVVEIFEPAVSASEKELLLKSAESLKATWALVQGL